MHLLTSDPRPTCGHEDCESWYAVDLGWVTNCLWTTPALDVTA